MQIRSFVAPSMPDALTLVREALGPDAVLLKTRMIRRGPKSKVEITAAADRIDMNPFQTFPEVPPNHKLDGPQY